MNSLGVDALAQLGLPLTLGRAATLRMRDELELLWTDATRREPEDLSADLEALRAYFDPVATGRRLREALLALPPRSVDALIVSEPLIVNVADSRALITPEGRIALALLDDGIAASDDVVTLDREEAAAMLTLLLATYRDWGRHRLNGVLTLIEGGKALQISAVAGALTLLVNRSDLPERAMPRLQDARPRDAIDAAFRAPLAAFADVISPSDRRSAQKERLISGWTLHEVNRRLPGALVIENDRIYVEPAQRDALVSFLGRELARPRRKLDEHRLAQGFDALVESFREHADILATFGVSFERPSETRRLRAELLDALQAAL